MSTQYKNRYMGLSTVEAKARLRVEGPNELVAKKKRGILLRVAGVFAEPMLLLLLVAGTVYLMLGEIQDSVIMFIFIFFIAGISLFQEWRTEKTLDALKELSSPVAKVIRDGFQTSINSSELVRGDIVILEEGDRVPADIRLLEASDLEVDESSLTGESTAVKKSTCADENGDEAWKGNICYAGTLIVLGNATGQVIATGAGTEYGKISDTIAEMKDKPTPLQVKIKGLIKIMAVTGLSMCFGVAAIYLLNAEGWLNSVLAAVTLAMAVIPEELPVVLTIFLSVGAWRLAQKHALIRRIPAVETLGACTVLCVDKTGTLTMNRMTVRKVYANSGFVDMKSEEGLKLLTLGILSSEKNAYDPMEKAFVRAAIDAGIDVEKVYENELVHEYSFDSELKIMGHVWDIEGEKLLAAKGSPETILSLCRIGEREKENITAAVREMADAGMRVLAFAKINGITEPYPDSLREVTMDFAGVIGLVDPPRPQVPEAIKVCKEAGVRVIMVTGDYGRTALAIGRDIGLAHSSKIITGAEIDLMSDEELKSAVKECDIFSRVMPLHKVRIVKALKENGDIVAMTGDGVNDAPALKLADIGIAMGKRGTVVAREAASMVLLNDDFTTIVDTIKDGRRIYDNIIKAIAYVIVIHIPIAASALIVPLLGLPLLLLPIHVVFMELLIDPTSSIVFEKQKPEKDIMRRGPRPPMEPLVSKRLFVRIILQGTSIFLAVFLPYYFLIRNGESAVYARSIAISTLILSNLFFVLVAQSEIEPAWTGIKGRDDVARFSLNIMTVLGLAAVMYMPWLAEASGMQPLSLRDLFSAAGLAFISTFWWEIVKAVRRRKKVIYRSPHPRG